LPGKLQVFNIVVIALQYSLVILLYYFLYKVVKIAVRDLARLTSSNELEDSLVRDKIEDDSGGYSSPRLVVIDDKNQLLSKTLFTITDSLTIGRGQHNTIIIDNSFVSHEHACISRFKSNYLLADLNSTNGTIVNGRQIEEETALTDGDIIQIGAVMLKFER
jgi:hypothetical protein